MATKIHEALESPGFGEPIDRQQADKLFRNAREVEDKNLQKMRDMFKGDEEAFDYFARPNFGYVFSKKFLEGLLAKLTSDEHFLVLLQGAKPFPGGHGNGRRTVIAMVYKESGEEEMTLDTTPFPEGSEPIPSTVPEKEETVAMKSASSEGEQQTQSLSGKIGTQHPGTIQRVASKTEIPGTIKFSELLP